MSLKADVLIVGAGGMGALFGSILQAGGLEVVLQDTNHEHVEAGWAGLHDKINLLRCWPSLSKHG